MYASGVGGLVILQVVKPEPLLFYIDVPTSKSKVAIHYIDKVVKFIAMTGHTKFGIFIPCGARSDFMCSVKNSLRQQFGSGCSVYMIMETAGEFQTNRSSPTISLFLTSAEYPQQKIPTHAETNKCRAFPWESLRLRCQDEKCRHLTPIDSVAPPEQSAAAFIDDEEKEAEGETMQIDEAPGGDEDDGLLNVDMDKDLTKKGKSLAKDVFCVAKPLDHYRKVLNYVLQVSSGKIIIISRSSHPGLPVAARQCGLEVFTCVDECPQHSRGHGEDCNRRPHWK